MPFDLKITLQPDVQFSPQERKLSRLIEKIEQQKISLAAWQTAQQEIQQRMRQKLLPVYAELHEVLFQQLEQLWDTLHSHEFSKADVQQLDEKISSLAKMLKHSKMLSAVQQAQAAKIDTFYQQHAEQSVKKSKKTQTATAENPAEPIQGSLDDDFEHYAAEQQQAREQAKQQRQQQKREQAEKMAEQSLKTVYLKIAAMIHPDREPDPVKKDEKTELFQQANQAYEQQDLFYLLKLQLNLEQNKGQSAKGLTAEQVKFYKLALDAQSQQLASQLAEILDSFNLGNKVKAEHVHIGDVYKAIDADCAALKQQVKAEKERLKYMGKVKGVEVLLGGDFL